MLVCCRVGVNSSQAVKYLIDKGYNAVSIKGGVNEYARVYDSEIPLL